MRDPDIHRQLDDLLERRAVSSDAAERLSVLLQLLERPESPTSVHDPSDALLVHIADSLAGLEIDAVCNAEVIADLGAGAGLPGLVLAAALPRARVFLVESAERKCRFLRRAVAALGVLCEYAAPLLRIGGVLVAWKGTVDERETADAAAAAARLGLQLEPARGVVPFAGSLRRSLHVARKVAPTPPEFPRRPGMATKRPLTAKSQL